MVGKTEISGIRDFGVSELLISIIRRYPTFKAKEAAASIKEAAASAKVTQSDTYVSSFYDDWGHVPADVFYDDWGHTC